MAAKSRLPEYNYKSSAKQEEQTIYRRIGVVVVLTFFILVILFFWGTSFINRVGLLLNRNSATSSAENTENTFLAGPHLEVIPVATNSAYLDIKGYSQPKQDILLTINDTLVGKLPAGDDGSFIFPAVKLNETANQISAVMIDKEGNKSPAATATIVFDKTPPKLQVDEPVADLLLGSGITSVRVRGKTDNGSLVTVNGTQVILDQTGAFDTTTSISSGTNKIQIAASDIAGNQKVIERTVTGQ